MEIKSLYNYERTSSIFEKKNYSFTDGNILGANYRIYTPHVDWNGSILLYCHGYFPIGYGLEVELDSKGGLYNELLDQGWIISASSYRREGVIIYDAIDDVINLRNFIIKKLTVHYKKQLKFIILEGQSMGGTICTRLAERYAHLLDGVVGVGAALDTSKNLQNEDDLKTPLLYLPMIPIIYLTNDSELGMIESYMKKVKLSKNDDVIAPSMWIVNRAGHNLCSYVERLSAIRGLLAWLTYNKFSTPRVTNNTFLPLSSPTKLDPTKGIVVETMNNKTSFTTNFSFNDLVKLGIKNVGQKFELKIAPIDSYVNNISVLVTFDSYPFVHSSDGDLIAFKEPDFETIVITPKKNIVSFESLKFSIGVNDEIAISNVYQNSKISKIKMNKFQGLEKMLCK